MAGGEGASRRRGARAHQQGICAAPGLWFAAEMLQVEMPAVVVERVLLRPDAFHHRDPLFGVAVAVVVLEELRAEHLEFLDVPARHDVEAEGSAADMVRCDSR